MGRPSKLTPELSDRICSDLEAGLPRSTSALRAGITYATLKSWVRKARRNGKQDADYVAFLANLKKAEADAEAKRLEQISGAAEGGQVIELTTVERRTTNTTTITTTEKRAQGQWTAAAWWLERKYPERWGRMRGELDALRRELAELRKLVTGNEGGTQADAGRGAEAPGARGGTA